MHDLICARSPRPKSNEGHAAIATMGDEMSIAYEAVDSIFVFGGA